METKVQLSSDGYILLQRAEPGMPLVELKLHVSEVEAVCQVLKQGARDYQSLTAQQADAEKLVPPLRRKNAAVKMNRYFFHDGPVEKRLIW